MWELNVADNKIKFFDEGEHELINRFAGNYHQRCRKRYNTLAFRTDDGMLEASKIIESLENSRPILRPEFSYEEINDQIIELKNGSDIVSTIQNLLTPGFDLNFLNAKIKLECFDTLIFQYFNNNYFTESQKYEVKTEASMFYVESENSFKKSSKILEKDKGLPELLKEAYKTEICSEMIGINSRFVNLLWMGKNQDFYLTHEYDQFLTSYQKGEHFFKKICDENVFFNEELFANTVSDYIQLMYYFISPDNVNELEELLSFLKTVDGPSDDRYCALNENFKMFSRSMNSNISN